MAMKERFIPAAADTFFVTVFEDKKFIVQTLLGYEFNDQEDENFMEYLTPSDGGLRRTGDLEGGDYRSGIMQPSGRVCSECHLSPNLDAFVEWAYTDIQETQANMEMLREAMAAAKAAKANV